MSRWSCRAIALFSAIALGLPCAAKALGKEFRAADIQAANYPTVQALEHMNSLIATRTGGRHSVKVFHSGQLGEENETIIQTRSGVIEMNRINAAPLTQYAPDLAALTIPFLFASINHLHRTLDGPAGQSILAGLEEHGFIGLAFYDSGARSLYTNTPVRSLADMKNLRISVQQSAAAEQMIRAMGAVPVTISYGQVLTSLTTKLVGGAENNWPSYVTTNHFQVAKYYILTEHTMAPEILVMSKIAWDTLNSDDQKIFRTATKDSAAHMRTLWLAWEDSARKQAIAQGNTIIPEFDRAAFVGAMAPVHAEAEHDTRLGKLIKSIREAR